MYNDTKVCISDIDNTVKKIEDLLVTLETEIYKTVQNLANDTEAWESKYQKVFDKHLTDETKKFILDVKKNCEKYNTYLKKTMQGYKKIDMYR